MTQLVNDAVRTGTLACLLYSLKSSTTPNIVTKIVLEIGPLPKTNLGFLVRGGSWGVLGQQPVALSPWRTRLGTKPFSQAGS